MLTSTDVLRIRGNIASILQASSSISPVQAAGILPIKDLQGKLYEAHILATIIQNLTTLEGCTIKLVSSGTLTLKQKGSPINRTYPYFEVYRNRALIGEIFTDTEFLSLSFSLRRAKTITTSDYHELDIVTFSPGLNGRPRHEDVLLAVECKATSVEKSTFREVLGFRRELALLQSTPQKTSFNTWPINLITANPPSVHMFYSIDRPILKYKDNAFIYGILVIHETM